MPDLLSGTDTDEPEKVRSPAQNADLLDQVELSVWHAA